MFEQDYIMRLIKELIRTALKLLFNIDTDIPTAELLDEKEEKETLNKILDLVDNGKINQAENELYELLSQKDMINLEIALLFYSYLNEKEDDFLEKHNFSREEIKMGLKEAVSQYGLDSMAETFLTEI